MTVNIRADHLLMLRATGHSCAEIGKLLSVSSQVVSYRLRQIKKRAAREGIENTFFSILNSTNIQDYYTNNSSKESLTDVSLEGFGESGFFELEVKKRKGQFQVFLIEKYKNEISRQISESNKSIEELQQTVEALSKKVDKGVKKWLNG